MILFPPCKINVGLRVLRKRADGFHDLESVFFPVPVRDALEVLPADNYSLSVSGLDIPGDLTTNLCTRAWQLLKKDFPDLPYVQVYLHKHIPIGGGLGGGSADGAYMLRILNQRFQLGLSPDALPRYAARLGSDCPFFLQDGPCLATGRGEKLQPITLNLEGYALLLVHPGIHVDTAWAFSRIVPNPDHNTTFEAAVGSHAGPWPPVREWRHIFLNDFETPVFDEYPAIRDLKEVLYAAGALYASMTGSGSAVYALFPKGRVPELSFHSGYWKEICTL